MFLSVACLSQITYIFVPENMAFRTPNKKITRQYSVEYLKLGFIPAPDNPHTPMCLLCGKMLSNEAMKPSRLKSHLMRMHKEKEDKPLSYFQSLCAKYKNRKSIGSMFAQSSQQSTDGLHAAYNISLMIAKSGKPHTIGEELILPAVQEVLHTVLKKPAEQIIKAIPLSNNSVQRRVDEMAGNIEEMLCNLLRNTEFSLQLDESTLPGNESLLLAYVRFVKEERLVQELLFAKQLIHTRGECVFREVENYFKDKNIPFKNIIACATDGAPSMMGRHCGFVSLLKKAVPDVFTIHCVIHRQHLVAKKLNDKLHSSMGTVITAVNKIKAHALNSRLFKQLCIGNDEEFERLLLHTEVRWLSKGNCLKRFHSLFASIIEFFEDSNPTLCVELEDINCDIGYLADLFARLNELNLQLQGDDTNLIKAKSSIGTFLSKLDIYKKNIGRRDFHQFPSLLELKETITDDDLLVYCAHLDQLSKDMSERFQDLLLLKIPDWVINPFLDISYEETGIVEEELVSLINDIELRPKFRKSYQDFWLQTGISDRYPHLWNKVKLYFIAFPTSYLVERGFSAVTQILTKQRNRLQITERGDLRLLLSSFKPDVEKLLSLHHAHPSH